MCSILQACTQIKQYICAHMCMRVHIYQWCVRMYVCTVLYLKGREEAADRKGVQQDVARSHSPQRVRGVVWREEDYPGFHLHMHI